MKLCIPSMGTAGLEDYVSEHFGRAPSFTVVDMAENEVKIVQNTSEHFGGQITVPELVAATGAEILLCGGIGPRAISAFEALGIEVYVGVRGTVRDAVSAFQTGQLSEATDADACRMHQH